MQYWICLGVIKEGECAMLDRFGHNTTGGMCDIGQAGTWKRWNLQYWTGSSVIEEMAFATKDWFRHCGRGGIQNIDQILEFWSSGNVQHWTCWNGTEGARIVGQVWAM